MEGDGGEESAEDDPDVSPAGGTEPGAEGSAEWFEPAKGKLSTVQATAFEVAKLRAELDRTARFMAGNENPFLNTFWQQAQMAEKEEDLKVKEAALAAIQDKAEKERLAKEEAERAAADLQATEQVYNDAQKAREAQKIKAEAARIHADLLAEEDNTP